MAVSPTEITRSQADHLALQLVSARIGAAFYVVWGVLHLIAARGICELASSIPDGPAHARLEQGGLNLGLFAVQTMAVAVLLNWRNNRIGFWLNIIVIGAVDTGYVMLLIVPGYFPASFVALAGPIVYVIGAMFSTAGLRQFSKTATAIASRADILYCAVTVQSLEDRSHLIADRRPQDRRGGSARVRP